MTEAQRLIQKGFEQGIEQGIKQGIKQGAEEKGTSIARALLHHGMKVEEVASVTGLRTDKVQGLEDQ